MIRRIKPRSKPRRGRLKGPNMEALRLKRWNLDKGICRKCGKATILGAHHTHPDSFHLAHTQGKAMHGDYLENTGTECGECHRKYHNYGPSMTKPVPPKVRD